MEVPVSPSWVSCTISSVKTLKTVEKCEGPSNIQDPPGEIFCLICGHDLALLSTPVVVKQEVIAPEDRVDEGGEEESIPRKQSKGQSLEESGSPTTQWTDDDKSVYRWFLTRLKVTAVTKSLSRNKLAWDVNSGKDGVPFCFLCKDQLMALYHLERTIGELQTQLKRGILALTEKINGHEANFRRNNVYQKDGRYERIRKQIVKNFKNNSNNPPRTKRGTKGTGAKGGQGQNDNSFESFPVVRLSTTDKAQADQRVTVKVDVEVPEDKEYKDTGIYEVTRPVEEESDRGARKRPVRKRKCRLGKASILEVEESDDMAEDNLGAVPGMKRGLQSGKAPEAKKKRSPPRKKKAKEKDWTPEEEAEGDKDFSEEDATPQHQRLSKYLLDAEKKTLTYLNLVFHQQEPFTDNRYRCSKCNAEVLHHGQRIRFHYLSKHSDEFACKQCEFRTYQRKKLRDHVSVVHENQPKSECYARHPCRFCGKPLIYAHRRGHEWSHKNAEERRQAIASGSKEVPWERKAKQRVQCEECGKQFITPSLLKLHTLRHHLTTEEKEAKKELCQECGGRFTELQKHYQRTHGVNKVFQCMEPDPEGESGCGKVFKSLKELTRHKNAIHRKIRDFKCPLCPREFTQEKNLATHMNLHKGIRPYPCPHCPGAFSRVYHLQRHVAVFHHSGEGDGPRRKSYMRGPTMLGMNRKKRELIAEGKYLPPSALASWAAGRKPTSHFPLKPPATPTAATEETVGGAAGKEKK